MLWLTALRRRRGWLILLARLTEGNHRLTGTVSHKDTVSLSSPCVFSFLLLFFFFLSNGLQRGNTGAATACDTVTNFWLPVSDLTGPCSLPLITAFIIHIYYRTQTHELARSFLSLSSSLPQCPCVSLRLGDDTEPQRWPKVEIWFS